VIGLAVFCCLCPAISAQEIGIPAEADTAAAPVEETAEADTLSTDIPEGAVPDSAGVMAQKSPSGAMLRSLAIPGWGQFYNEQWLKGIFVAGVELGILANAFIQNNLADKAETKAEREFYMDNRNLSYWWLAGTILLSMADAYVDAHLFGFDESIDLGLDIREETAPFAPQVLLVVSVNF
jgi:hypothetical protein